MSTTHPELERLEKMLRRCGFNILREDGIIKADPQPIQPGESAMVEILNQTEVTAYDWPPQPLVFMSRFQKNTPAEVIQELNHLSRYLKQNNQPVKALGKLLVYIRAADRHQIYSEKELLSLTRLPKEVPVEDVVRMLYHGLTVEAIREYQPAMTVSLYLLLHPTGKQKAAFLLKQHGLAD